MKKLYFALIITIISFMSVNGQQKAFPIGGYIYSYHGVNGGLEVPVWENIPGVVGIMTKWKNWFDWNIHHTEFGWSSGYDVNIDSFTARNFYTPVHHFKKWIDDHNGEYLPPIISYRAGYSHKNYFTQNNSIPKFFELSLGQYINISKCSKTINVNSEEDYILLSSDSRVRMRADNKGFDVVNSERAADQNSTGSAININALTQEFPIIDDIQIWGSELASNGSKYLNRSVIRPWTFNTTTTSTDTLAHFYVRIIIDQPLEPGSTGSANSLTITLKNQYPVYNNNIIASVTQPITTSTNTVILNFNLDLNETQKYISHAFGIKLEARINLAPGGSIGIKDITIYDAIGKAVMENDFLNTKDFAYGDLVDDSKIGSDSLIVELGDESTIGSFECMRKVKDFITGKNSNVHFYFTAPENCNDKTRKRILDKIGDNEKIIIAPDPYCFSKNNADNYKNEIVNALCKGALAPWKNFIQNRYPKPTLYAVLQTHEWRNLRLPSKGEIISETYATLMNNFKGIFYYAVTQDGNYSAIYKARIPQDSFNTVYNYLSDPSKVCDEYSNAMPIISNFLKKPRTDGRSNGSLLLTAENLSYDFVGVDANLNNLNMKEVNICYPGSKVNVGTIAIVDNSGNLVSTSNLLGATYFEDSIENAYLMLTNLNRDGHEMNLEIDLKSCYADSLIMTDGENLHDILRNNVYQTKHINLPTYGAKILKFATPGSLSKKTVKSQNEIKPEFGIFPNPFNPETNIRFAINKKSNVKLCIYNIQGKIVAEVANGEFDSGIYNMKWNGNNNSSGIYFLYGYIGDKNISQKLLLLK